LSTVLVCEEIIGWGNTVPNGWSTTNGNRQIPITSVHAIKTIVVCILTNPIPGIVDTEWIQVNYRLNTCLICGIIAFWWITFENGWTITHIKR
jgi:hypothetical protein